MLSCKEITEKANEYLESELPFGTRLRVRMHLLMCTHCRRYVKQLQTTIRAIGLMKEQETVDENYTQKLVERYKKEIHAGGEDK
jgi:hypothetical protein